MINKGIAQNYLAPNIFTEKKREIIFKNIK